MFNDNWNKGKNGIENSKTKWKWNLKNLTISSVVLYFLSKSGCV